MDDWLLITVLMATCVVAVAVLIAVALYMAKLNEWLTGWGERLQKIPARRRVAIAVFLLPVVALLLWALLGSLAAQLRSWPDSGPGPTRSQVKEAVRELEQANSELAELGLKIDDGVRDLEEAVRQVLYEDWKARESRSQKAEFRNSAIAMGRERADVVWDALENADDPAYKSDLAYVLQQILGIDVGVAENEVLSEERLQEVEGVLRVKMGTQADP